MACPYFEPDAPLVEDECFGRVTLGQTQRGSCAAGPMPPSQDFRLCNGGYARGQCFNFPPESPIDAYRFAKSPDGGILWIEERDHRPIRFGTSIVGSSVALARQHAVFVQNLNNGRIA